MDGRRDWRLIFVVDGLKKSSENGFVGLIGV